jgi:hypothetical protein
MKMSVPNLLEISKNRKPVEVLLKDLTDENMGLSLSAGQNLVAKAKKAQLCLPDYLRLAVDVNTGDMKDSKLDGYEASLAHLNLPIRDDFQHGVLLEAAAETFQTYPGTRALFPVVIDDIVQWKYRQDQIESIDPIIGQTRTINGTELLTTVVDDKAGDYQVVGVIAEASNIPTRSIRTSERSVKIYKFGGGYEFTYEFERRARLDLITPFAMRNKREMAIGQAQWRWCCPCGSSCDSNVAGCCDACSSDDCCWAPELGNLPVLGHQPRQDRRSDRYRYRRMGYVSRMAADVPVSSVECRYFAGPDPCECRRPCCDR